MSAMHNIKTIVFDLGNVVFDISFDNMYGYWSERYGVALEELRERLVFDEMYCEFERGAIEPEQYRDYAIRKLGIEMDYAEFDRGWNNIYLDVLPGINELVRALRPAYRLCVLTNTNAIHALKWRDRYASVLRYFNDIFCSFEMGARKPEEIIFELMLQALNQAPSEVLFLDDKSDNVEGAIDCGVRAALASSYENIKGALCYHGITYRDGSA